MSGLGEPAANQARCVSTRAGPWCLSRWSRPVNHVVGSLPPAACTACPISLTYSAAWARVQDAHGIRTVIVDQPLQPLRSILHCTHLCRLFQPSSLRFHQRCLRKALGLTEARKRGNLLRADLPALVAGDLPHHDCLDFRPLAPHQVHHRSIRTQHLLVCSTRCLGHLLLEALHLPSHTASAASPVVSVARRTVALLT